MTLKDLLNVIDFGFNEHREQVTLINVHYSNDEQEQEFSFNFGLSDFVVDGKRNIPLILPKKILNAEVVRVGILHGYLSVNCVYGEE